MKILNLKAFTISALIFDLLIAGQSSAAIAMPSNYLAAGNIGDDWVYAHIIPSGEPNFTVNLTEVSSGANNGKRRIGDYPGEEGSDSPIGFVFDVIDDTFFLYEHSLLELSSPVALPKTVETDQVLSNPFSSSDSFIYLQTQTV